MKKILVIGAGRSAIRLVKYLFDNAEANNWFVTVADFLVDGSAIIEETDNGRIIFVNKDLEESRGHSTEADIKKNINQLKMVNLLNNVKS